MKVQLTGRDERLLKKCLAARWLTTSQIKRLFFSCVTDDAVRKRLRKLSAAGFLRSFRPHQMAQAFYTIGAKGKVALESLGVEVELKCILPKHLEHFIGINDVRVAVESCTCVVYFFAAWELGNLGWRYNVIPDAVFSLNFDRRLTFLLEHDRGGEPIEMVCRKLGTYAQGLEGFSFDGVLVTVDMPGRLESLRRHLLKQNIFVKRFVGALLSEIRGSTILSPLFIDLCGEGKEKHFLQDY